MYQLFADKVQRYGRYLTLFTVILRTKKKPKTLFYIRQFLWIVFLPLLVRSRWMLLEPRVVEIGKLNIFKYDFVSIASWTHNDNNNNIIITTFIVNI